MAVEPAVFVPPIVVAHLLGFILLLYSVEKVSGIISKTFLRRRRPVEAPVVQQRPGPSKINGHPTANSTATGTDTEAEAAYFDTQSSMEEPAQHRDWDSSQEARAMTHLANAGDSQQLTAAWVRGCTCQVYRPPSHLFLTARSLPSPCFGKPSWTARMKCA